MKFITLSLMAQGILLRALIKSVTMSTIQWNVDGFSDNHSYCVFFDKNSGEIAIGRMSFSLMLKTGFSVGREGEFNHGLSISPFQVL